MKSLLISLSRSLLTVCLLYTILLSHLHKKKYFLFFRFFFVFVWFSSPHVFHFVVVQERKSARFKNCAHQMFHLNTFWCYSWLYISLLFSFNLIIRCADTPSQSDFIPCGFFCYLHFDQKKNFMLMCVLSACIKLSLTLSSPLHSFKIKNWKKSHKYTYPMLWYCKKKNETTWQHNFQNTTMLVGIKKVVGLKKKRWI